MVAVSAVVFSMFGKMFTSIVKLKLFIFGCHIRCIVYADDIILLCP